MTQRGSVAVIGGGIAGLSAAYRLQQQGWAATVFEERDRVGGRMCSFHKGDFLIDSGVSAYLGTYRESIELIAELGLSDQMSDVTAMGGFMRDGKRYCFDFSKPLSAVGTGFISWPGKLRAIRLLIDTFRARASLGYDDYSALAEIDKETVEEYCKRRLNDELYNYVARTLVSGTWVADDKTTSMALLLWTLKNMVAPSVYNLDGGVASLAVELAKRVTVHYCTPVEHVVRSDRSVEVTAKGQTQSFDGCVIATTAQPALAMYPQMDAATRELYSTAIYRRLGSIALGYSERPKDPATYYLASPYDDPDMIAIIADHNKARCRAPEGKGLLVSLLSHEYMERTLDEPDEVILDRALQGAEKYFNISPSKLEVSNVARWAESVPTLAPGRFRMIADYKKNFNAATRVQFASDLDRIPGVNGALVSGQEAAIRLNTTLAG